MAIPSKGQLYEGTLNFLNACGLFISRLGYGREYLASLRGIQGVDLLFLRAEEIPEQVEHGTVHLGITGEDLYHERAHNKHHSRIVLRELGYGDARLVVAIPRAWIDVTSMDDLEEIAILYRHKYNRTLRVATKFPNLTREFFTKRNIVDYYIVQSLGATEGAPASGVADIIVDLSSTGATLAQNHLKEIDDGTLMSTQACLIASTRLEEQKNDGAWTAFHQIVDLFEAHLHARTMRVLRFVVPRSGLRKISSDISKRFGYSVISTGGDVASEQASGDDHKFLSGATVLCSSDVLYSVVSYLRNAGCIEITVDRCDFIFGKISRAVESFRHSVRRQQGESIFR